MRMRIDELPKYINALRKCGKEHENDKTPTGHIIVTKLCQDTADLLEELEQEPKIGHCKNCKYFEYDSIAKVDGIPLIVAHEICSKWGNGCKSSENGYCFLFEPKAKSEGMNGDTKKNKIN